MGHVLYGAFIHDMCIHTKHASFVLHSYLTFLIRLIRGVFDKHRHMA